MNKQNTQIRGLLLRGVSLLCILCVTVAFSLTVSTENASAYTTAQLKKSVATDSITTGSKTCGDYFKLTTKGSYINVEFKHEQDYSAGLSPRLIQYPLPSNSVRKDTRVEGSVKYITGIDGLDANSTAYFSYNCAGFADGTYYFRICGNKFAEESAAVLTDYPSLFSGVKVVMKNGQHTLHRFANISSANKTLANSVSYTKSKTKSLSDYRYQLFCKKGTSSNPRKISANTEANYYKKISDKIVKEAGATTNYEKAYAIFRFVAGNFYYDNNAIANGRRAYDDPYYNLKYQQNKTGNSYNAYSGKVALHCDGFAGIYTALARAQGIPTRMVYGHKIVQGKTSWELETAAKLKTNNHTWVQCRIGGRWVNIDPQQGSSNTYGIASTDYKSDRTWKKSSVIKNYYFDISYDQFAATHKFIKLVI